MHFIKYCSSKYDNNFSKRILMDSLSELYHFEEFKINKKKKIRTCYRIEDLKYNDNDYISYLNEYFKDFHVPATQYCKSPRGLAKTISILNHKNKDHFIKLYNKTVDYRMPSYLVFDINNFYGSINHTLLLKKVENLEDNVLHALVEKYLKSFSIKSKKNSGIPLGISLSHILSEFFLIELDAQMKIICNKFGYYYIRYVDNFCLIKNRNAESNNKKEFKIESDLRNEIENLFTNKFLLSISFQERFYSYDKKSFTFLGYDFLINKYETTISVNKAVLNDMKVSLNDFLQKTLKTSYLEYEKVHSLKKLNCVIRGYNLNFMKFLKNQASNSNKFLLAPFGISTLFSVVNNFDQIKEFERWLGSFFTYFKHEIRRDFIKKNYKEINIDKQMLVDFDKELNDVKLESLVNWSYRFKKNFQKSSLLSHKKNLKHFNLIKHEHKFEDISTFKEFYNQLDSSNSSNHYEDYDEVGINWGDVERVYGTQELDELDGEVLDDILTGGFSIGGY